MRRLDEKMLDPSNGWHAVLIDLDDTLYLSEAIPQHMGQEIRGYMVQHLGYTEAEAFEYSRKYYIEHGTTLAGLEANGRKIDWDDWHQAVHHTLDYESLLQPNPELRRFLNSILLPKFIFTNADREHARRCLDRIGIADCFQGIIDFETTQAEARDSPYATIAPPVVCKPHPLAYHLAMRIVSRVNPSIPEPPCFPYTPGSHPGKHYIFLDDSTRNVPVAHDLGMFSILVRKDPPADVPCSAVINTILEASTALPELLGNPRLRGAPPAAMHVLSHQISKQLSEDLPAACASYHVSVDREGNPVQRNGCTGSHVLSCQSRNVSGADLTNGMNGHAVTNGATRAVNGHAPDRQRGAGELKLENDDGRCAEHDVTEQQEEEACCSGGGTRDPAAFEDATATCGTPGEHTRAGNGTQCQGGAYGGGEQGYCAPEGAEALVAGRHCGGHACMVPGVAADDEETLKADMMSSAIAQGTMVGADG